MRSLYQRLKELDPAIFERLCYHLLKEQYPTTEIRHVEGGAGDEGLDLFTGDLDIGSVVWQCKAFPNGIGQSQREQIRESLRRALSTTRPRLWVLCTTIDLDAKAYRWWQRLQHSYREQVQLGLLSASEIVHQLLFRRTIRETFFPQAIMDVAVLRSSLAGTTGISTEELGALTADNAAQFLDRLAERDPRFSYEVTFRHNTGPTTSSRTGALVTVSGDDKTISVFPRDHDTVKRDPPTVTFNLAGEGVNRFQDFLQTGKPANFAPGELTDFRSAFDFLLPANTDPVTTWQLNLTQSPGKLPTFSFRITIGDNDPVVYDLVTFQTVRTGTKEAELRSTSKLPFELRLIIDFAGTANITWHEQTAGFGAREVHKAALAIARMTNAEPIEVYNLETGKRFLKLQGPPVAPAWVADFVRLTADAVAVSDHYGVELPWPSTITHEDLATLARLKDLINGVPVPIETATVTMTKVVQVPAHILREHLNGGPLRFAYPPRAAVRLFGTTVSLRLLEVTITEYRIMNKRAFAAFLNQAPIGTSFTVQIRATHGGIATTPPHND